MSLLAPLYLLLGAGIAVPLLLHLMRRNIASRVEFPAARYLQRAEQEHSKSMRLRNLLLMLLRILLILALTFAAARPLLRGLGIGHGPTAIAIVLDNSLSTSAVSGGSPVFTRLRDAVRDLITSSTNEDRLWLVTADGRLRGGSRDALLAEVNQLSPSEDAGDLSLAVRRAAAAVQGSTLPSRTVAIVTDGQATAWPVQSIVNVPASVFVPSTTPPSNRAILSVDADPARWTPRGTIAARATGGDSLGYRMLIGSRTLARGTIVRGSVAPLHVAPPERGWQALRAELEPDEFSADDSRYGAVWIGAPIGVTADASAGPFVSTALGALVADGRAAVGSEVRIASADNAVKLPALLTPPSDPVRLGAANRELARLGIPWRLGALQAGSVLARGVRVDDVPITSRYRLMREGAAAADTLGLASGEPWIVSGPGYVLIASRIDNAVTTFPIRATFVPWLADMIGQRLGAPAGDVGAPIAARPGAPLRLPAGIDAIENSAGVRRSIDQASAKAPDERGVWFLLHGPRRVGALVVNAPAEESALERLPAATIAARIAGARGRASNGVRAWIGNVYSAGTQRPITTPLLILALLLIATEAVAVRSTRMKSA